MGLFKKLALRSKWLARRLWLVMLAEVAFTGYRHWRRLDADERNRLFELARKSNGRPSRNLSARERAEANDLLDKLGHLELFGTVAAIVLPFRPLSTLATKFLTRGQRKRAAAQTRIPAEAEAEVSRGPAAP